MHELLLWHWNVFVVYYENIRTTSLIELNKKKDKWDKKKNVLKKQFFLKKKKQNKIVKAIKRQAIIFNVDV